MYEADFLQEIGRTSAQTAGRCRLGQPWFAPVRVQRQMTIVTSGEPQGAHILRWSHVSRSPSVGQTHGHGGRLVWSTPTTHKSRAWGSHPGGSQTKVDSCADLHKTLQGGSCRTPKTPGKYAISVNAGPVHGLLSVVATVSGCAVPCITTRGEKDDEETS
jgi:hypothetical protein